MNEYRQKLFDLRALIAAKKSSLVWRLVDMQGRGENETKECQSLAMNVITGFGKSKADDWKKLSELRKSGKNVNPRFVAIQQVLEHWKKRWMSVQSRLEAEGAV